MKERSEIEIEVPYFEKGQELHKKVNIKYVSFGIAERYNKILQVIMKGQELAKKEKSLMRDIGGLVYDKSPLKERRNKIKTLNAKKDKIHAELLALEPETGDTYNRLITLTKDLLERNGCEDPDLYDQEFWTEKVEAEEIWKFLNKAISKDIKGSNKKK